MTSQPVWTATVPVTPDRARTLINSRFPETRFGDISLLGVGWDNIAYLVEAGDQNALPIVFRFPQRDLGGLLMKSEIEMLGRIPELPLSIPHLQYAGAPGADYPYHFMGYPLMPGNTTEQLALNDRQRTENAVLLGRFLAALHSLNRDIVMEWSPPKDPVGKLNIPLRNPRALELVQKMSAHLGPMVCTALYRILMSVPESYEPREVCLVHGDLYARHLLADEAGQLCGVIDWGDVHLGDPAVDLMAAHQFLPKSAHLTFLATYGNVDEITWSMARLRAIWHALAVLDYAVEIHDSNLAMEFQGSLSRITE